VWEQPKKKTRNKKRRDEQYQMIERNKRKTSKEIQTQR
jgi:hypothetical protein